MSTPSLPRRTARAAAVALGALGVAAAFGRAGGGGHAGSTVSSGGQSSNISFGGGGGGNSLGGFIALIVIAFLVWYFLRRFRSNGPANNLGGAGGQASQAVLSAVGAALGATALARTGSGPMGSAALAGRPALPPAIDAIRALDPGFELETFLQRAEMTFFLVKRGMQRNDAAAVRPYLNDAVFGAVSGYIGQMKGQHRHALYESLNVRAVHLESAACDAGGQAIQVHFDLVYRLKNLDDANRVVSDEGTDARHAERWTFTRAAAARTPVNGDVTASKCPACGAELRLNLDGSCAHCRASVTNGTVDWVVADVRPATSPATRANRSWRWPRRTCRPALRP